MRDRPSGGEAGPRVRVGTTRRPTVRSVDQMVAPFYSGWRQMNDRLIETVGSLSAEELASSPAPGTWPIWAIAAHLAAARVYWLCAVLEERGAAGTPFTDPSGEGWEDDLSHPRHADELTHALGSSWAVVDACLQQLTTDMLQDEFRRVRNGTVQIHTRQSVIMRLITHDSSHAGEISQTLGSHGRVGIDLWSGLARMLPAAT